MHEDRVKHFVPNAASQVLGGTAQRGDTDVAPREEDRQHIWSGCLKMMPSLAAAKVLTADIYAYWKTLQDVHH